MTTLRTLALSALLASALTAQAPPAPPAPQGKPTEPELATLRAMKSRIFMVRHQDPMILIRTLRPLGSGVNGSVLVSNSEGGINSLSARDYPENLAAIEEALKRLDVPAAVQKATDVELTLHVLFASRSPVSEGGLPAELQDVVKQLRGTLAYRGYSLAASFVQRVQVLDNARSHTSGLGHVLPGALGTTEGKDAARMKVEWRADGLRLTSPAEGPSSLDVEPFRLDLEEATATRTSTLAKFNTPLSIREGERVVVGTSVVKDHGVVVVLTAHRIKR